MNPVFYAHLLGEDAGVELKKLSTVVKIF